MLAWLISLLISTPFVAGGAATPATQHHPSNAAYRALCVVVPHTGTLRPECRRLRYHKRVFPESQVTPRTDCIAQVFGRRPAPLVPCHRLWREIAGLGTDAARQLAPKGPYANCITISMTRHGDVRKPCARSVATRGR
jgi:hypothetical protein